MKCGYITHDGERVFLPGCMGGAIYGPAGCTCPQRTQLDELLRLHDKVAELEKRVLRVETANESSARG